MSEMKYVSEFDRAADALVLSGLQQTLATLRANKPDDRSEKDRAYAVTATEMEKVVAYFKEYAIKTGGK